MDKINLKENIKHGNYVFPFMVYLNENRQDDTIQYCHWHDELEFIFVTKGRAIFQVESNYYEVDEGQVIFINQGEIHAGFAVNHTSCSFCAIVFNPEMLFSKSFDVMQTKYLEPIIKKHYLLPVHICGVQNWEGEIFKKLCDISEIFTQKPTAFELIIKANLYLIISIMLSNTTPMYHNWKLLTKNSKTESIKKVLSYIHENYQKKITITELAEQINISNGHFHRFFKEMTKITPIDYLNNYRVNHAAFLLLDSTNNISRIALDVGFENISYFIKMFKKHLKCTPKEYRRLNRCIVTII